MSRLCKIILLLVLLLSAVLPDVSGARMIAEIETWNSVALSGDVLEGSYAAFLNTSHRKGSVSKGDTATLVIDGMYGCKVLSLTAWLKSNKSSGAGSLLVSVDGEECLSLSGTFDKWDGSPGYQTSFVPFSATGEWLVSDGGQIELTLVSSANSLHIEKLVVDYEEAVPVAHCVTYLWQTADGPGTATDCEQTAGEGIILPDLSAEGAAQIGDWQLAGWSTAPLDGGTTLDTPPAYTPVFKRYHASRDITLYPVYRYMPDVPEIRQSADRRDGEYVIAREWVGGFFMMAGGLSGNYVHSVQCDVLRDDDGSCLFLPEYVPAESRYLLQFGQDSVSIYNAFSQTKLGYSGTRLAANGKKWALRECDNHSVCFYYDLRGDTLARTLMMRGDVRDEDNNFMDVFSSVRLDMRKIKELLFLFEVSDLPLEPVPSLWCGNPYSLTDLQSPEQQPYPVSAASAVKCIAGGQLLLRRDGRYFDVLGREVFVKQTDSLYKGR